MSNVSPLYYAANNYFLYAHPDFSFIFGMWAVSKTSEGKYLFGTTKNGILGELTESSVIFEKPLPTISSLSNSALHPLGIQAYAPKTLKYGGKDWVVGRNILRGETPKIITDSRIEFFEPPKVRVLNRAKKKELMHRIAEICAAFRTLPILYDKMSAIRSQVINTYPAEAYTKPIEKLIQSDVDAFTCALQIMAKQGVYNSVTSLVEYMCKTVQAKSFIEKILRTPGRFYAVHYGEL